jgi:hypothetical protein
MAATHEALTDASINILRKNNLIDWFPQEKEQLERTVNLL